MLGKAEGIDLLSECGFAYFEDVPLAPPLAQTCWSFDLALSVGRELAQAFLTVDVVPEMVAQLSPEST